MKIYAPKYYNKFCCIADKCRHSCCIGWEIDIDNATYEYYKNVSGQIGKKLSDNIHTVDNVPCFQLDSDDRCPFLNNQNLCEIIINLGEDKLCGICSDHPRYHNYYSSRIETGIGLCCEEAARLILTYEEKMQLISIGENGELAIDNEGEDTFFAYRQRIFDILQDRASTVTGRIDMLINNFDIPLPKKSAAQWAEFLHSLERLDEEWNVKLDLLQEANQSSIKSMDNNPIPAEQLLVYFLYRHMSEGIYDGKLSERIAFAIVSCCIIFAISDAICKDNIQTLADIARMYSAEIEYSDENIEKILEMIAAS